MIKRSLHLIVALLAYVSVVAQSNNKEIAPFKIRLTNGEGYTYSQLEKEKPVILVYFSPTCDHCKSLTEAMLKSNKISNSQVVMISFEDIRQVKIFDDEYKISSHKNIKIGSEGYTFVVQKYYNIEHFPFVATFDKNKKLKKIIPWNLTPEQMVGQL